MLPTGFNVCVQQAEALVGDLRERFDVSAGPGMPAHITELFPSVIPHLTVAHGDVAQDDEAQAELAARLRASGAIHGLCDSVLLLENAAGRWRELHRFALPADGPQA